MHAISQVAAAAGPVVPSFCGMPHEACRRWRDTMHQRPPSSSRLSDSLSVQDIALHHRCSENNSTAISLARKAARTDRMEMFEYKDERRC